MAASGTKKAYRPSPSSRSTPRAARAPAPRCRLGRQPGDRPQLLRLRGLVQDGGCEGDRAQLLGEGGDPAEGELPQPGRHPGGLQVPQRVPLARLTGLPQQTGQIDDHLRHPARTLRDAGVQLGGAAVGAAQQFVDERADLLAVQGRERQAPHREEAGRAAVRPSTSPGSRSSSGR
ncbi:hypothetical protein ACFQ60_40015 [Streptomyces zhihengii]